MPYKGPRLTLVRPPNAPDHTDLRATRRWIRSLGGPTAIDLFCGAGGLSLGLKSAGFQILVGADAHDLSIETHVRNLGGLGYSGDLSSPSRFLRKLEDWGVSRVDLIAAGLPCQPFSRAGRSKIRSLVAEGVRDEDDSRTSMWRSLLTVVRTLRPKAVLLENVPDMAVWEEGSIVIGVCESLRELGYTTSARILNAFEYGVPQHRSRLFIVGLRGAREFDWPRRRGGAISLQEAIGDLPRVRPAQRKEELPYGGPKTPFQRRMRRGVSVAERAVVHDHITRDLRPDDAEAFALLKSGQAYADLPSHLRRYDARSFKDKYNRLPWNGLSRSITAHLEKDGYWYIHPRQGRTISIREAARIQTFPDWFRFAGQPSLRFRQIGNAVPPLLAAAIGRSVANSIRERSQPKAVTPPDALRKRLLAWHQTHGRSYPWRKSASPWHVLIAEMCLRRTRADQVDPVYRQLLSIAPSPAAMVKNSRAAIRAMRSLGLMWRARNMTGLARALVRKHHGEVPSSNDELRKLPGVGDYVAGAVRAFGFGHRAVLLDTNTMRIVGRLFGRNGLSRWQMRLDLYELAGRAGPDAAFNYAMLDLGALVCRAARPICQKCPMRASCQFSKSRHRDATSPSLETIAAGRQP